MTEFHPINVPPTWAGFTRETADGGQAWACGACPNVEVCIQQGTCVRAKPVDFEYGNAAVGRVT